MNYTYSIVWKNENLFAAMYVLLCAERKNSFNRTGQQSYWTLISPWQVPIPVIAHLLRCSK